MLELIYVPLHSYDSLDDVDIQNIVYKVSATSATIKLVNADTDETIFYGLYPNLPKIDKKYYREHLLQVGGNIIFGSSFLPLLVKKENYSFDGVGRVGDIYYARFEVIDLNDDFLKEARDFYYNYINYSREINKKEKKEGQNKMANLFGDIKVGKAGSKYSLTYFGTIAYDGKTYYQGKIFDATGMTINFDMLYLIPSTEVKKGDIIEKSGRAYYVLDVNNGVVKAVDLVNGTEENLVPGGPFGMTMYSKVFNPMGNMTGDNSFGNMLMMQALMGGDNYGNNNNGMLLAMMMMQGGFKFPTFEMPNLPNVSGEKVADNK